MICLQNDISLEHDCSTVIYVRSSKYFPYAVYSLLSGCERWNFIRNAWKRAGKNIYFPPYRDETRSISLVDRYAFLFSFSLRYLAMVY